MGDRKMGHVQSMKTYVGVFGALVVLTVITYLAAGVDFGSHLVNEFIAVGIAGVKAMLVTLFFMHGKYEKKETWLFIIYPGSLVLLLIGGIFLDFTNRKIGGGRDHGVWQVVPKSVVTGHHEAGSGHGASDTHGKTDEHGAADAHATPADSHGDEAKPEDHGTDDAPSDDHGDSGHH